MEVFHFSAWVELLVEQPVSCFTCSASKSASFLFLLPVVLLTLCLSLCVCVTSLSLSFSLSLSLCICLSLSLCCCVSVLYVRVVFDDKHVLNLMCVRECMCLPQIKLIFIYIYVMVWWSGRRTGHRQRSQYKWRPQQAATANRLSFYSSRQFLSTPKILTRTHR